MGHLAVFSSSTPDWKTNYLNLVSKIEISLSFFLLSISCPLWTRTWTFMQHSKSLDFVHALKRNCTFCTASLHNFGFKGVFLLVAREARKSVDCPLTAYVLLRVLVTFTIIFVLLTIVAVSCCIIFSAFLFWFQQTLEVSAKSFPPGRALVLFLILRPKRQSFG